jgi:hypothetical protein
VARTTYLNDTQRAIVLAIPGARLDQEGRVVVDRGQFRYQVGPSRPAEDPEPGGYSVVTLKGSRGLDECWATDTTGRAAREGDPVPTIVAAVVATLARLGAVS